MWQPRGTDELVQVDVLARRADGLEQVDMIASQD